MLRTTGRALLLLVLATLGLLLRVSTVAAAAEQRVLSTVQTSLGPEMTVTLHELLTRLRQGSIVAMTISVVALLVTASTLFRHLRLSFRAVWKYELPLAARSVRDAVRETLTEQATAFLMLLSTGALLILTLGLAAVAHWLSGLFSAFPRFRDMTARVLALPVSFVLATLTFCAVVQVSAAGVVGVATRMAGRSAVRRRVDHRCRSACVVRLVR